MMGRGWGIRLVLDPSFENLDSPGFWTPSGKDWGEITFMGVKGHPPERIEKAEFLRGGVSDSLVSGRRMGGLGLRWVLRNWISSGWTSRIVVGFGRCGAVEASSLREEVGGRGGPGLGPSGGGGGRPPGSLLRSCPSPAASEQTFLSLQVEAGAAGGGGCAANQAACAAERGALIPGSVLPADPQARDPGAAPASALSFPGLMARGGRRGRR